MDKADLETYQVQLSQVELALSADPENSELKSLRSELKELIEEHGGIAHEVKKTVGDVAAAFIVTGSKASIVVLQAAAVTD